MSLGLSRESVLHVGAGRYGQDELLSNSLVHWKMLSQGFEKYTVVVRGLSIRIQRLLNENLEIRMLPSVFESEAEFLFSQMLASFGLKERRPTIWLCQSPVFGGLAAQFNSLLGGTPSIMEIHGCEYFKSHRRDLKAVFIQNLTKIALRSADRVRVLSPRMLNDFTDTYGQAYRSKLFLCSPYFDDKIFSPFRYSPRPKNARLTLLIAGALNHNKGQLRLLQSLARVEFSGEIWIAGSGRDLIRCQRFVESGCTKYTVRFLGYISRSQLAECMAACDALVVNSISEGTPRVIVEAMAMGLPVITTDAGYCGDLVRDGIDGCVIRGSENDALAMKVSELAERKEMLREMGAQAQHRAHAEFHSEKYVETLRAEIKKVVGRAR